MKNLSVKLGFALFLSTSLGLFSQVTPSTSPAQLQAFQDLADKVKEALQRGDLNAAVRFSSDLMTGIYKQQKALEPTPQERLAKLEQAIPPGGAEQGYALTRLAMAAFDAGELNRAEGYGRELLLAAQGHSKGSDYGNAVFYGNMIVGRVALRRDKNVVLAKTFLLAAAHTPGSPTLNSFGPNMSLAKDLLTLGERDVVLEFFTLCRAFWKPHPPDKLDGWIAMVKGGGMPYFGANLVY